MFDLQKVQLFAVTPSCNWQAIHTHIPLSPTPSSIIWEFGTSRMATIPIPQRNVTHFTSASYSLNYIALITVINSHY